MGSQHYLCVHAHFYQPSREDPATGQIPNEPGARPYENWNERILANCYQPNAELGNFSHISFNIGPTLARWMKQEHPDILAKIVNADRDNVERFGVGNAMAQAYHHSILPLANRRDKQTQIRWGIYEFERTFQRKAQGMWLPETAVDQETLEVLAENGIEFTILAPWQADEKEIDPRKAYQVILPNHKAIKVIFYHGALSSSISFDPHSTENADIFVRNHIKPEFIANDENQWITLASDGELYGHHQVFRDKFLSYLLNGSTTSQQIRFSYPALQIQQQSVFPLVKIRENTSWSCHHGIQRWKGACSCTPNGEWKKHLRDALERLSVRVDQEFENACQGILQDAWEARDKYIEVISGDIAFPEWLKSMTEREVSAERMKTLEALFNAELDCQRMFASCGWFFEDLDRIEPRNNITCAAHAVWLVKATSGIDLTPEILPSLEKSKSWVSGMNGADLFTQAFNRFYYPAVD